MTIRRTVARLSPVNYVGRQAYSVTIVCALRNPYLATSGVAKCVLQILFECANRHSFKLHAYCAMPDHLHILAEGLNDASDLGKFIRLFKQRTAFEYRQAHHGVLWEMSYYDHLLRPNEPVEIAAAYIWQNPVRKKLCADPALYPFSGSQSISWMQPVAGGRSDVSSVPFSSPNPQTWLPAQHRALATRSGKTRV